MPARLAIERSPHVNFFLWESLTLLPFYLSCTCNVNDSYHERVVFVIFQTTFYMKK